MDFCIITYDLIRSFFRDIVFHEDAICIRFESPCCIKVNGVKRSIVPGDVLTIRLK